MEERSLVGSRNALYLGVFIMLMTLVLPVTVSADDASREGESRYPSFSVGGEFGFLAPVANQIQYGSNGTEFDYVDQGGQNNLFPFYRLFFGFSPSEYHHLTFLYQPLDLQTDVVFREDVRIDNQTFSSSTPMRLRYGFSFFRGGYHYDFFRDEKRSLSIGGALQIRNATINFASKDGGQFRSNRDVGPVPLLRVRSHFPMGNSYWFEFDADGFYAPIKYINGGDTDVTGAIVDASIRVGHPVNDQVNAYVNLRYLAGGGEGTSPDPDDFGDGYVENWLQFAIFSVGARWDG